MTHALPAAVPAPPTGVRGALALTLALLGCGAPATPTDGGVARDMGTTADTGGPPGTDAIADLDAAGERDSSPDPDTGPALDAPSPPPRDAGPTPPPTSLLLNGTDPMPCADPAIFSESNANATYYAYCTGMAHVWRTGDWARFTDERAATRFDLTGMSANGQSIGAWWAPGIVYDPDARTYVMWVSVPDARGTRGADGWDTRGLAVLTSPSPTGPWTYRNMAIAAGAVGEHYIDPFPFRDHDGRHYVFWKQYGGGISSSIMGAAVDAGWLHPQASTQIEVMNGFGGPGTWEDNVRENPAIDYDPASDRHRFVFSGGHWQDDTYATGAALSACGPLCVDPARGGWHMVTSGDRGIDQVVRANGDPNFTHGGPGGAVFQDDAAEYIVYAAAARSARGDADRYLMRQRILWRNGAPYVDTAGHHPAGL